ncbi:hypothetical protein BJ741DRAFT_707156 [Chytriomyces cf. hyalinus JEL632]|nr:hypothetical protein BJ741DRAFT_707156 [Chytriomyces cf. hyalinus JEL632]
MQSDDNARSSSAKSTLKRASHQPDPNPSSINQPSSHELSSGEISSAAGSLPRKSPISSGWSLARRKSQKGSGGGSSADDRTHPPPVPALPSLSATSSSSKAESEADRKSLGNYHPPPTQSAFSVITGSILGGSQRGNRSIFADKSVARRAISGDGYDFGSSRNVDVNYNTEAANSGSGKRGIHQRVNSSDQSPEQAARKIVSFRPTVEEVFEAEQSVIASIISDENDSETSNTYPKEHHPRIPSPPPLNIQYDDTAPENSVQQLDSFAAQSDAADEAQQEDHSSFIKISPPSEPFSALVTEDMASSSWRHSQNQNTSTNLLDVQKPKNQRRDSFQMLTQQLAAFASKKTSASDSSVDSDTYMPAKAMRARLGSFMGPAKEGNEFNRSESAVKLPEYPHTEAEIQAEYHLMNRRQSTRDFAKIKLFDVEADAREPSMSRETKTDPKASSNSFSAGMGRWPHARDVSENFSRKLTELKYIMLSVVLNACLLLFAHFSGAGITLPLSPGNVHMTLAVVIEIILLSTNILTTHALDFGVSIFLSMLMTNKSGYGMCACGFVQEYSIKRLKYAQSLSLNSTCRRTLERTSYLWLLLEVTKTLTPIAATAIIHSEIRALAENVNCIVFEPNLTKMYDRTYPTIESTSGAAEVLFGDALGCMRAERATCGESGSLFVFGPQLQGVVANGDTIVGPGFEMVIETLCQCMDIGEAEAVARGYLTQADQRILLDWNRRPNVYPFVMHLSNINITGDSIVSSTAMGNTVVCGGYSKDILPICQTTISKIQDATVSSMFSTDGTTASIALVSTRVLEEEHVESQAQGARRDKQDWSRPVQHINSAIVHRSLTTMFPVSSPIQLVSGIPGQSSALLSWSTSDLKSIDPVLLAPGIETLHAIFLRAGFQRTFASHGSRCPREIRREDATIISISWTGVVTIYLIGSIQLALSLLALLLSSVWFLSPVPLGPAIRIVTQPIFFIALLSESPFGVNLQGTANGQSHVMWQQLDLVARIGESLDTLGEPIGRIRLDRPRMVKNLKNGRFYA